MKNYEPVLLGRLSEDDRMSVVLTVKDWKAIAEALVEDADAEGLGPAEMQLELYEDLQPNEAAVLRARAHDAQRTACHSCAAATLRVVEVIQAALERNGWPN